jgi:hypothetical protein
VSIPNNLISNARTQFDLTEAADQESLYALAEALLALPDVSPEELKATARSEDTPLEFKIAAKLADSRRFLQANDQPLKVGVLFAMWGEQHRLHPKSADNPHARTRCG